MNTLQHTIEAAWDHRELLSEKNTQDAIREIVALLDEGTLRVAEPTENGWQVNEWVKKAVVMYFPIQTMETIEVGPFEFHDKMPVKKDYKDKDSRKVTHAVERNGDDISKEKLKRNRYDTSGEYVSAGSRVEYMGTGGRCG